MPLIYYRKQAFTFEPFLQLKEKDAFVTQVKTIIKGWLDGKEKFSLFTSGSTGKPKEISFSRNQLEISAKQTFDTFNLESGDSLLCCLSPEHTAGFMMIIRALMYDCDLYLATPSANPFIDIDIDSKIDFAAFVPYQMQLVLEASNINPDILNRMKAIILGGGPVSDQLKSKVNKLDCSVYHTYGMTETLTHVAIKNLKSDDNKFHALKGVEFSQNDKNCLIVKSPIQPNEEIVTNDVVKLIDSTSFEWIGRFDFVINTGGFKIQINQLENKMQEVIFDFFPQANYFISAIPDKDLGDKMILIIETNESVCQAEKLIIALKGRFKSYEIPKKVIFIQKFVFSSIGKIDRNNTLLKI
jgi:o-succinylbenzoate---CoA ligase